MPHADSALVPSSITTKSEFWEHVYSQLEPLLEDERNWVTNLANASSVIFNALAAFPRYFGTEEKAVNWCGFYLDSPFFPAPRLAKKPLNDHGTSVITRLLLGPFCGRPACQFINTTPGKARGVCADAYMQRRTLLVPEVDLYPGHIACDGDTKSEIVIPLIVRQNGIESAVGVLDLDCLGLAAFDAVDQAGLEKIAQLVANSCDW